MTPLDDAGRRARQRARLAFYLEDTLTAADVARLLGVSRVRVHQLTHPSRRVRLVPIPSPHGPLFLRADVDAFRTERKADL